MRWDRDHALLVDGQPGPAQLEAPRVSYMANLTTTGRLAPELGKLVTLDLISCVLNQIWGQDKDLQFHLMALEDSFLVRIPF